ncbi:MAG: hypothetical protein ACJ04P_00350 [Halioglobus sp.]
MTPLRWLIEPLRTAGGAGSDYTTPILKELMSFHNFTKKLTPYLTQSLVSL